MGNFRKQSFVGIVGRWTLAALIVFSWGMIHTLAGAFTLEVRNNATDAAITGGYRWLVEVDNTLQAQPGNISGTHARDNAISLNIHNSHAPVVAKGRVAGNPADVAVAGDQRYFVSVLPDSGYAMGGAPVALGQAQVTVYVNAQPIPTAQISVFTFLDQNPVNNGWDEHDPPLGGCKITIKDDLGELSSDAFGNPIGSTYNPDGTLLNIGSGNVYTLTQAQFIAGGGPKSL